ncbi:MAG: potassium channel family protein [Bacteroidales bacterium]|nr:potassium channel family protein [Bacteroidales bacterium]
MQGFYKSLKNKIHGFVLHNLNLFLLISIIGLTFSPTLSKWIEEKYVQQFFFTIMFLSSVIAVKNGHNRLLYVAIVISALSWINILFNNNTTSKLSINYFVLIIYFAYIISRLIVQLVKIKEVNANVIMEAINVYLLIGILGAAALYMVNAYIPGSIEAISTDKRMHEYIYFSFVTLASLGYGDISPSLPLAKTIVVFLAIFGQFYIAVIMAFLVSKFLAKNNKH